MLACSAPATLALAAEPSADGGGANFREVTVLGDGVTKMVDGSSVTLDAQSARAIVDEIQRRGLDLPIDLDHATLYAVRGFKPAPAVGFLKCKTVTYVPGVGIRAQADWNDDGAAYLHSGGYRYTSPVVIFNKKTGRPVRIHSFSLTNTPLTQNAPALRKAASEAMFGG